LWVILLNLMFAILDIQTPDVVSWAEGLLMTDQAHQYLSGEPSGSLETN
jgi:hypothetical protein